MRNRVLVPSRRFARYLSSARTTQQKACGGSYTKGSAQHLEQILEAIPDCPILLFWDRATWHRGAPIRRVLAENPRPEIVDYPVAAPELNPQEQVWKQTRRAISHNHLTPKLPKLADDFENHLTSNTFDSSFLDRYGYNLVCSMLN